MVKKVRTTISLDMEDYQYLSNLAKSQGLSFSDIVRLSLKQWINQRKSAKQA
jgi:negative regulator of replication initiation